MEQSPFLQYLRELTLKYFPALAIILVGAYFTPTVVNKIYWHLKAKRIAEADYQKLGIRKSGSGEFHIKFFDAKDILSESVLRDVNVNNANPVFFKWVDNETIIYEGQKKNEEGAFNPETLEKKSVQYPAQENFPNRISQASVEKNYQAATKKFPHIKIDISNPVKEGFLFPIEMGALITDAPSTFWVKSLKGLYLVTSADAVEVVKGKIKALKTSPDGCKAVFLRSAYEPYQSYQIGLINLCN